MEEIPDDITMHVNSNTFVSGDFRRYPLHQLFEYAGQWYYRVENSVKYPEVFKYKWRRAFESWYKLNDNSFNNL